MTTAANVRVGVTGDVYTAPEGTAVPTALSPTPPSGFDAVGYLSEDGFTQAISADITDLKAWQNGDIVRKIQTSHDVTYAFTMIETSDVTLATYYGTAAAGVAELTGDQLLHGPWVFDVLDGNQDIRIVLPDGQITERGDVVYQNGDAVGYPVTVTAFPDGSGVKAYIYYETGS